MKQQLSIAFITNNYLPYSGGVVSSIHAFYDELTRQGHKVTIVTLDFGQPSNDGRRSVIRCVCPIKFRYKENYMAIPVFMYSQLYTILKNLNPDIVHVHHPFLLGSAAVKVAKKLKKPIVFTYHTLYEHYIHYIPLPKMLVKFFVQKFVRNFCAKVTHIIAPSKAVQQALQSDTKTPIIILPSPLNKDFFLSDTSIQLQKRTRFSLVSVSRFAKEKNIYFLLDMFAQLNCLEYELTLVGYGSELEALQLYAYKTLSLSESDVRFIIKPTKKELIQYYTQADLFVYASQTETQGLVMLEAMACAVPVVALCGPGQQDFVYDGINGYLVSDVSTMVTRIKQLATDRSLLHSLSVGARKTVEKYTPVYVTNKLIELYKNIL